MSAEETQLLYALAGCRFHPGSADARFCHDLAVAAGYEQSHALTEGQRSYLNRLGQRTYRQLPPEIVARLKDPIPPSAIARARFIV
jgi:hypothetical protein